MMYLQQEGTNHRMYKHRLKRNSSLQTVLWKFVLHSVGGCAMMIEV